MRVAVISSNNVDLVSHVTRMPARGETIIVTMGSRGAMLLTTDAVKRIAPVRVTPVDTIGAGDAFVGSFARYYVGGEALDALNKAVRYAANSITRRGTQKAYATEAEFEVFCRTNADAAASGGVA